MRYVRDDQPQGASTGTGLFTAPTFARVAANGIFILAVCAFVAACGSSPSKKTSKKRSKEYFSEKKYGVSASPRVAAAGKPVRKGGGRYMVGRPYKVAGKWYRPRNNTNYRKSGYASWYGAAFHGRMTANGEIYDMNGLSAAHTTLPLPSYVRVTNLKNRRSVIVRVNDRGPFHGNRVIDLSKRTAELLDFKKNGVAKVRVKYVGKAPLHGRDHGQLMASYRGPGRSSPGATMPGTMLASAQQPAEAAPPAAVRKAPVPPSRPYYGSKAPVMVAYDPAAAYSENASSVMVAALDTQTKPQSEAPASPRNTTAMTGTYDPETLPGAAAPTYATEAPDNTNVRKVRTFAFTVPGNQAASPPDAATPASVPAINTPTIAPRQASLPRLPSARIGTATSEPATSGVGGPFVVLPSAGTSSVAAGGLFYAEQDRVSAGHQVIAEISKDSVPLKTLKAQMTARNRAGAVNRKLTIRLGLFRDLGNAERLGHKLARLGRIERRSVTVKGKPATMLSLTALHPGISADAAILAAERAGAHGAFVAK